MKKIVFFIMLALLIGCSSDGESIEYEDDVNIDEQTLTIEGETTLEDGSDINYEITSFEAVEILDDGKMEVSNGTFSVELDASDYPAGEFEVYIAFLPYMQSEEIQELYGEMGENLQLGEAVVDSEQTEDLRLIESRRTFEKQ